MISMTRVLFALNNPDLLNQLFKKLSKEDIITFGREINKFKGNKVNLLVQRLTDANLKRFFDELDERTRWVSLRKASYENYRYMRRGLCLNIFVTEDEILRKKRMEAGC